MIKDGLWDPYGDKHMGNCAEMCADKYTFTREAQDAFALELRARPGRDGSRRIRSRAGGRKCASA